MAINRLATRTLVAVAVRPDDAAAAADAALFAFVLGVTAADGDQDDGHRRGREQPYLWLASARKAVSRMLFFLFEPATRRGLVKASSERQARREQ